MKNQNWFQGHGPSFGALGEPFPQSFPVASQGEALVGGRGGEGLQWYEPRPLNQLSRVMFLRWSDSPLSYEDLRSRYRRICNHLTGGIPMLVGFLIHLGVADGARHSSSTARQAIVHPVRPWLLVVLANPAGTLAFRANSLVYCINPGRRRDQGLCRQ
jgi:hypothetical protein